VEEQGKDVYMECGACSGSDYKCRPGEPGFPEESEHHEEGGEEPPGLILVVFFGLFGVPFSSAGLAIVLATWYTRKRANNVHANGVETDAVVQGKDQWITTSQGEHGTTHTHHHWGLDLIFDADRADGKKVRVRHTKFEVVNELWNGLDGGSEVKVKYLRENPTEFLVPQKGTPGSCFMTCFGSIFIFAGLLVASFGGPLALGVYFLGVFVVVPIMAKVCKTLLAKLTKALGESLTVDENPTGPIPRPGGGSGGAPVEHKS
jgi:hypothetical protein